MTRLLAAAFVTLAMMASQASAATPNLDKCLDLTGRSALRVGSILNDLGLTRDVERAALARLSSYNSVRGFQGLDGIGLTPEQIATIMQRLQAQSWPLGYPCKPFAHRSQTIAFVREILVDNGFRRASIRITSVQPRQFQFQAIQDGFEYFGAVARSGTRQIAIRLDSAIRSGGGAGTYRFVTRFEP